MGRMANIAERSFFMSSVDQNMRIAVRIQPVEDREHGCFHGGDAAARVGTAGLAVEEDRGTRAGHDQIHVVPDDDHITVEIEQIVKIFAGVPADALVKDLFMNQRIVEKAVHNFLNINLKIIFKI